MVGSLILKHCLESNEVESVTSIVRRPSGVQHNKLIEIIHDNFEDFSTIDDVFKGVDTAYYCLGAYTGAIPDDQFKRVTVNLTVVFATALQSRSPRATFCFLSGQGADTSEKSKVSFARYKGMAENDLIRREFGQLYIFRPGYIYPVQKRKEPNVFYQIFRSLFPLIRAINSTFGVKSTELAEAMFLRGLKAGELMVIENSDIHNIVNNS